MEPDIARKIYEDNIIRLNQNTPDPARARRVLDAIGMTPDRWETILKEGAEEDALHESRALIAIVRGDERPMGDIYRSLRVEVDSALLGDLAMKSSQVARRHDPHDDYRSGSF